MGRAPSLNRVRASLVNKLLEAALVDSYRLLDAGASVEECISRYPQFTQELRDRLQLHTNLVFAGKADTRTASRSSLGTLLATLAPEPKKEQRPMLRRSSIPVAILLTTAFLGLAAAVSASTAGVSHPDPSIQGIQEPNGDVEGQGAPDGVPPEGGPPEGLPPEGTGPGTGHASCTIATQNALDLLQGIVLPRLAENGESTEEVNASIAEIQNCGTGADDGDGIEPAGGSGGPPEGEPGGPPDTIPAGPPANVPLGPPDGVPQGPPADTPLGPPANVPLGPPANVPLGPPANVPLGPPANVPLGPPDGVPGGPPDALPIGGSAEEEEEEVE
jgi:hypothetical protein